MKLEYILLFCCLIIGENRIDAAYELILEKIESASIKDNVIVFDGLRVNKFNRTTFVVNGKYTTTISADDEIDVFLEAFNLQGGQYKKMFEKKLYQLCKSLYVDTIKGEYEKFYAASSVKVPYGTCPFPAGDNKLTNLMVSNTALTPPYLPGGEKWRVDIRFLKHNEILGGYNVYALLRNEESLLKGG